MNNLFKIDNKISLDEDSHKYFLKDKEYIEFCSVTEYISSFFEKFDKEKIASNLITCNKKYSGRTKEDLINEWDKKSQYGTLIHKEIENYINKKILPKECKSISAINWLNKYLTKSDFQIFPEVITYCEHLKIAGSIDLLLYDKNNGIYNIMDWKTSKIIETKSYKMKTGNKPETLDLLDCNFNHYSLQLSLYRYLLEKKYGIKIQDQLIIHINDESVNGYLTPYLNKYISSMLNTKDKG